jgi:two-component system, OmpR family, response regulator CpxR
MSGATQLLLLEDDGELAGMIKTLLEQEGYGVDVRVHGTEALSALQSKNYHLALLDVMVPGLTGLEVLGALRKMSRVPVIMLTAKGSLRDRVHGLQEGADDYLVKPFEAEELVARVHSVLRRSHLSRPETEKAVVECSGIRLNRSDRTVTRQGTGVDLTTLEFNILEVLMDRAGSTVTRDELSRRAQMRPMDPFDRSLDVHIMRLRRKLESGEPVIRTIRGVGYLFVQRSTST